MKFKITILLILLSSISAFSQDYLNVDFRYAPNWHVTSICLPDDTYKSLVGPLGQLLYDFGGKGFYSYANDKGFKTVVQILADEDVKLTEQKLYSPKVPIVETYSNLDGLAIKQETFAYSSFGLKKFSEAKKNETVMNAPREDIVLTTVTNTGVESRTIQPLVIINSEHAVTVEGNVITIKDNGRLFIGSQVQGVRQNIGDEKTLVSLSPIQIEAGQTKTIPAIYDNDIASDLTASFFANPAGNIEDMQQLRQSVIDFWEIYSPVPSGTITIPDEGIQSLIDASLRNIWQAREIVDGRISFQVGPTCYRGLWIVDGAFILEAATMVGRGSDARDGIEYMLSFQQPNGKFGKLTPDFWKENGIVLWASVRHALLTQDKEWLKSVWPKLSKTVSFIEELRRMTLLNEISVDDGLIPPGAIDGGLWGEDDKGEYSNVYWNLIGLKAMVEAANWIGETNDAKNWGKEYDDFYASFQKAANRDKQVDTFGNTYLPIPMESKYYSLPQRAQWAFCQGVYPGQLFAQNDPIANGTMDMLDTTLQEGMVMGTGWIIDGIWNYFASFYGHAKLWMGDGDKAVRSLYAFANHASPLLAWREEHNPRDLPDHYVGDMPHNWASAEFIRLSIHLLALDRGKELHLFEGLPKEWVKPGMETSLKNIATPFGKLSFSLKVNTSGKSALLNIDALTDKSCDKIVVHTRGWSTGTVDKTIELIPSKKHTITINLDQ
ncbi:hypothetical protein K8352_16520 [Flavobacteriaceae bacterium F89]|uniref:Uncharacterized protein n=1 Tax=Cerina litoralis TaxID=2874477 RepID=A0AAE3EZ37_9FLAO|nr:hypothetical protein [Cerina litoralis]MCG2462367.1 hypothetical protein [Cerina litoralis]